MTKSQKSMKQSSILAAFAPDAKKARTSGSPGGSKPYKVYCDLDGVLVDFVKGYKNILGEYFDPDASKQHKRTLWATIAKTDKFYQNLDWTSEGKELWNAILPLQPDILTGVAMFQSCRQHKYNWCQRELRGVKHNHVDMAARQPQRHDVVKGCKLPEYCNIITCWSKFKHLESGKKCVLIDDRYDLKENWEKAGGIFIHHIDTQSTLAQLRERGILPEQETKEVRKTVADKVDSGLDEAPDTS